MTKVTTFLYTFVDEATGEFADITAPNESAARLWRGGDWILGGKCPLFGQPAEVGNWDGVVKDAQAEAAKAFGAMNAAMPKPGTITTPEALKAFNNATVDYERKKARVTKLLTMSVSAA
jgi:hypothetical protein